MAFLIKQIKILIYLAFLLIPIKTMNLSRGSTSNVITNPLANYFLVGPFFKLMPFKLSFFKMAVARPGLHSKTKPNLPILGSVSTGLPIWATMFCVCGDPWVNRFLRTETEPHLKRTEIRIKICGNSGNVEF